jgi:superfamily II DNA or RNA helicase
MIDESKFRRQYESLYKWRNSGGVGTLNLVMRFGKTMIGLLAIHEYSKKHGNADVVVVTPSVIVKEEWITQIKNFNISNIESYVRIYTANQLLDDSLKINCDILIIDEVHKFTSDKRLAILRREIVKSKYQNEIRLNNIKVL